MFPLCFSSHSDPSLFSLSSLPILLAPSHPIPSHPADQAIDRSVERRKRRKRGEKDERRNSSKQRNMLPSSSLNDTTMIRTINMIYLILIFLVTIGPVICSEPKLIDLIEQQEEELHAFKFEEMTAWIKASGGYFAKELLTLKPVDEKIGRGMVSIQDIPTGAIIMEIPSSLMFTEASALRSLKISR